MFGRGDRFEYRECPECRSLQISTIPDDLASYYGSGYYSLAASGPASRGVKESIRRLRDEHALFRRGGFVGALLERAFPYPELRSLSRVPGLGRNTRILDVGCGTGVLLRTLHLRGFRNLRGVDPFIARDIELAGGLRILRQELRDVTARWDLIMFHHSLEHVPNPRATLLEAAGKLDPDGHVLIRIPVVPNAAYERYGEFWVALDAPRHLFIPSIEGLRRLARSAAMRVVSVDYDSTAFQFWGSEQYRRGIPLMSPQSYRVNPRAFTASEVSRWRREAETLNRQGRGDQAVIVLEHDARN